MCYNGGDYYRWVNFTQWSAGIYYIEECWSAMDFSIKDYGGLEGYIALTRSELAELYSLPLDD